MRVAKCLVCFTSLNVLPRADRPQGGRPRRYCSSACRQLAYRYKAEPELAATLNALATGRLPFPKDMK